MSREGVVMKEKHRCVKQLWARWSHNIPDSVNDKDIDYVVSIYYKIDELNNIQKLTLWKHNYYKFILYAYKKNKWWRKLI